MSREDAAPAPLGELYVVLMVDGAAGEYVRDFRWTFDRERAEESARNVDGVLVSVPVKIISDYR